MNPVRCDMYGQRNDVEAARGRWSVSHVSAVSKKAPGSYGPLLQPCGPEKAASDLPHPVREAAAPGFSKQRHSPMLTAAYAGVVLFCIVHFFRPQDFSATLAPVPLAKITGIFAGVALAIAIGFESIRLPREAKLIIALFVYLAASVPFSAWPGGSFDVVTTFSKVVVVAIATMLAANTLARIRRLIVLQTLAMVTMAIVAFTDEKHAGRMYGAGNLFSDPNDFALNLCIVLPISVAMLLASRSKAAKCFWAAVMGIIIFATISTLSRGGLLALIAAAVAMWHRFRMSSRPIGAILALLLVFTIVAIGIVGSSSFLGRVSTIISPDEESSSAARKELLKRSLELTAKHPLFGVGPGQFEELSGAWHVTHNTYTQLSSEAGIPALAIFVALVWGTFTSLKRANNVTRGTPLWYVASGLYCALITYVVGAFFLSTTYLFFPYILMAYCYAASRVAADSACRAHEILPVAGGLLSGGLKNQGERRVGSAGWGATSSL
jgi:O-antigen ligase